MRAYRRPGRRDIGQQSRYKVANVSTVSTSERVSNLHGPNAGAGANIKDSLGVVVYWCDEEPVIEGMVQHLVAGMVQQTGPTRFQLHKGQKTYERSSPSFWTSSLGPLDHVSISDLYWDRGGNRGRLTSRWCCG